MHKVTLKTLLLALSLIGGLSLWKLASAGGPGNPGLQAPTILKTAIDAKKNLLIITGRNFGATAPTVTLADLALDVKRFSEHEVVASLPPDLVSATYGVMVITSGRNRTNSNLFSANLPDKK